ncbi:MAG TPA: hypothetical protein VK992_00945 [Candidatus Caenarcaniphilales bacterium]|nr:hypothetical protein [Candidatus Caenarcaniphilales bacterium]
MTDQPAPRERPSIAERAARRQALQRSERDRYANLVRALQAGRELPLRPGRAERLQWHPVAWLLLRLAILVVLLYAVAWVALGVWRDMTVDTWTGSDGTVTSGQRLAGCTRANAQNHAYFPTWIRFDDRVYVLSSRERPLLGQGMPGETRQIETGYALERLRILIPVELPAGEPPSRILVATAGAPTAAIFDHAEECE